MKNFFMDYIILCKQSVAFSKKHWLGILIFYAMTYGGMFAYLKYKENQFNKVYFETTEKD